MYIPTTLEEVKNLGWDKLDIILVNGDAYIDSSYIGVATIGKYLISKGFRVGIISQPDINSDKDITRLGEPELFWGVTAGSVDSMVSNYTASKKFRRQDDFTPGEVNNRRPNRASIVYTSLIRQFYKNTKPIVLGGIEASLRRGVHYDFWQNKIKRSLLFDTKADYLVYGMGERAVLQLANCFKYDEPIEKRHKIRGMCYIAKELPEDVIEDKAPRSIEGYKTAQGSIILPTFEECVESKEKFTEMYHQFYENADPLLSKRLIQKHDSRYLIQNPPAYYLTSPELDEVYGLDYERDVHPYDRQGGKVRALDTIRFSITSHRGCYAECNFCAIAVHQGRNVRSRSEDSIVAEAIHMTKMPDFKGYIFDVGGATANMYGNDCKIMTKKGACTDKRCNASEVCLCLRHDHAPQLRVLERIRNLPGVKKVFISSGLRYDLILEDEKNGEKYLETLLEHHVSGQLKIAPEHTEDNVLNVMGKPGKSILLEFKKRVDKTIKKLNNKLFMTYYMISGHPGCKEEDMRALKKFANTELKTTPEQVQIFTPTPSTYSTLMYHTEMNPWTGEKMFVEKDPHKHEIQKKILTEKPKWVRDKERKAGKDSRKSYNNTGSGWLS